MYCKMKDYTLIKRFLELTFIKKVELFLIPDKFNFSPLIWVSTIMTSLLMVLSILQQQRYVYYHIVDCFSLLLFVGVGKHDNIFRKKLPRIDIA